MALRSLWQQAHFLVHSRFETGRVCLSQVLVILNCAWGFILNLLDCYIFTAWFNYFNLQRQKRRALFFRILQFCTRANLLDKWVIGISAGRHSDLLVIHVKQAGSLRLILYSLLNFAEVLNLGWQRVQIQIVFLNLFERWNLTLRLIISDYLSKFCCICILFRLLLSLKNFLLFAALDISTL